MTHNHGDMDGMDGMDGMSGMGGMDMGSVSLFIITNKQIARALWYIVAAASVIRGVRFWIDYFRAARAKRMHATRAAVPSRPSNVLTQAYDAILSIFREVSYPAPQPFQGKVLRYFTPPSLGQSLLILTYWLIILCMLWTNVFLSANSSLFGYRWEKPAFRAGWVSVTQVPLLYALSCKFNVISIVTGISYERLNWMHRWVSRTLFLTVIVHWAYFLHEWTLADFVKYQLEIMPMVKYGFGAWAVLGWMVITGFGFFRDLCYELWVLQHLAGAGALLWLLYVHVPSYARYNVWMAVAFVAFDRGARGVWAVVNNLHLRTFGKGGIGYRGYLTSHSAGYLKLTVKDVDFDWRAGQHVFLSVPTCGIFQSHPFTIANNRLSRKPGCNESDHGFRDLDVYLKCHSGFTKKLQSTAQRMQARGDTLTTQHVFLSGPWGIPPLKAIERSNTLIFVATSTGASFNVPLLEHAVREASFVQRVCFYWIVRDASQVEWFDLRLRAAMRHLAALGVAHIELKIFVSGVLEGGSALRRLNLPAETTLEVRLCHIHACGLPFDSSADGIPNIDDLDKKFGASEDRDPGIEKKQDADQADSTKALFTTDISSVPSTSSTSSISEHYCSLDGCRSKPTLQSPSFTYAIGRPPSIDPLIRPAVEAAQGETVVVACGGKAMMAQIRTYIANLSDERAVHKGTGAQSIYLWTESYGW